jgi:BclA C-terminal domain/Collagen triple helix repeat (20 copies)
MKRFLCALALVLMVTATAGAQPAVRMFVDTPAANAIVPASFVVAGWAFDPAAPSGSGVDYVDVWAFPSVGGNPVFLGTASLGGNRPDLTPGYGAQFATAGYGLAVPPMLPAGSYTLRVFAHRVSTGTWAAVVAVPVVVAATTLGDLDCAAQQVPLWNGTSWVCADASQAGATGAQGPVGAAGPQGSTGSQGSTGAQGLVGLTGLPGTPGTNGLVGPTGPPATFQGAWSAVTTYATGAAVSFAGSSYVGLSANTNLQPDTNPASWSLLAQKGNTGTTGSTGNPGTNGTNGTNGSNGTNGAAGATGPAGGLSQYAHIYNFAAQVVAIEAPVLFSNNGVITAGITHVAGTSQITLTNSGTYEIAFVVSVVEPCEFAVFVNGAAAASSIFGSGAGTQQNNGHVILVLSAGDIVSLHNHSSAAAVTLQTLAGGTQTNVNASILIRKLS